MPAWYWLAFSNTDGFVGVCVVEGEDFAHALDRSVRIGCGGGPDADVRGLRLLVTPRASMTNRLLSHAEAQALILEFAASAQTAQRRTS